MIFDRKCTSRDDNIYFMNKNLFQNVHYLGRSISNNILDRNIQNMYFYRKYNEIGLDFSCSSSEIKSSFYPHIVWIYTGVQCGILALIMFNNS